MRARDRFLVRDVTCELGGELLPVVDLSLGGFFMATDHPPMAKQVVSACLHLPEGPAVFVVARVAWVNGRDRRVHLSRPSGCGVQMIKVSFLDKLAIVAAVRHVALPANLVRPAASQVTAHD